MTATPTHSRVAYSVWAFTFAVAVMVHEWQVVVPLVSVHTLSGIIATTVLVRPAAVWRTIVMCASLTAELIVALPNPKNYALLTYLTAAGIALWWLVLVIRSRRDALDPATVFERLAPFLRVAFLLAYLLSAFAKLNTDYLDTIGTCAPNLINEIPILRVPAQLYSVTAVGMVVLGFAIPVLLMIRRTRSTGIAAGFGFLFLVAAGGNPSYAVLALSILVLFLPTAALARAAATARLQMPRHLLRILIHAARSPLFLVTMWWAWLLVLEVAEIMPQGLSVRASRWSAMLVGLAWLGLWAWMLVKVRAHWLRNPSAPASLRVRDGVLIGALVFIVLDGSSPYLGLKSDHSFEEYTNLHTEPGHWNHLVVPEAVRIFDTQDHIVHLVDGEGSRKLVKVIEHHSDELIVVSDARQLLKRYPDAMVHYELDGQPMFASRVADDPVLGGKLSLLAGKFSRWSRVAIDGTCRY